MRSKLRNVILVCLGGAAAAANSLAGIGLSLNPPTQSVANGSTVSLTLDISGLGTGVTDYLAAFDLDVLYDSSLLQFQNVSFGDPILGDQLALNGIGSITSTTDNPGDLNLLELSLNSAIDLETMQATDFTLATLTFSAISDGLTALTLSVNSLSDPNGDSLAATTASADVEIISPRVGVPEASAALAVPFLAGVVAAGAWGARRRPRMSVGSVRG